MKDYKRLRKDLLLLMFIHKKRYYLLISGILSLCMFLTFYLFIESHIKAIIFGILIAIIVLLFILNTIANYIIKERSVDPYIIDIDPSKNEMELFSIEASAKRKIIGTDTLDQYYLQQKLMSRESGHIPDLKIPENYPRILMPSLVGDNIYCNYYVNVYKYQNSEFSLENYREAFYAARFNLHKENVYCNSLIIDIIIADNLNTELRNFISSYVNNYLFEPCIYVVLFNNKLYIPPISKNIHFEYQLDAYKEAINYLKDTLL